LFKLLLHELSNPVFLCGTEVTFIEGPQPDVFYF